MNNENELNPQGYVTILPVKEKMYTRDEVIDLCWQQWCLHGNAEYRLNFDKWIKQNL